MSMVLGLSEGRDKSRRKSCHRRNDDGSGELDVFDAEGYFSAINETTLFHELGMSIRDDCHSATNTNSRQGWREGRVSLDIPAMRFTGNHFHHHHHHHHYHRQHSVSQPKGTLFDKPAEAKERKHRQPSSPGGKLASFFSSLIRQTLSNKKKSSKWSTQIPVPANKDVVVEEVESPSNGWRRRGSSNSNSSTTTSTTATTRSRTTTTATSTDVDHTRTKQASALSGLSSIRTSPPPCAINTPTKSYKDFRCKNSSTKGSSAKSSAASNLDWLDEKFKNIGGLSDKQSNKACFDRQSQGSSEKERVSWVGRNSTSEESSGFKRFMEDDGGETDSSSDLFELQLNYECSSGLPVYETTCMDTIKRSSATPAITNV